MIVHCGTSLCIIRLCFLTIIVLYLFVLQLIVYGGLCVYTKQWTLFLCDYYGKTAAEQKSCNVMME